MFTISNISGCGHCFQIQGSHGSKRISRVAATQNMPAVPLANFGTVGEVLLRKSMTDHRNVPAKLFAHLKDPFGFAVLMAGIAGVRKVRALSIKIK